MQLSYFNIQRSCLQDGPGIRTVLFLKGCPLDCLWCHNPEGKSCRSVLLFRRDKCTGCGRCLGLCGARSVKDGKAYVDREACSACGRCVEPCLFDCNEICGESEDADAVFEKLMRDRLYFKNSGGGVTVSGGEPMLQKDAVIYLSERCRQEGVGFALETSGYTDPDALCTLASRGCLFLYDIKGVDPEKHRKNTGVPNDLILSNLDMLAGIGADMILRLPLVPGYNDTDGDLYMLKELISGYSDRIRRAEIMPYHRIGLGKTSALGEDSEKMSEVPDGRQFAERWLSALEGCGAEIVVN